MVVHLFPGLAVSGGTWFYSVIVIYSGRVSVSGNGLCNRIWVYFELLAVCLTLSRASTNHKSAGGRIGEVGFTVGRRRPSATSHIHDMPRSRANRRFVNRKYPPPSSGGVPYSLVQDRGPLGRRYTLSRKLNRGDILPKKIK